MEPVLRLFWDFFGPDAERTAEHHRKHIIEFLARSSISGIPELERDDGRVSVYLDLPKDLAEKVGRVLRPRRATVVDGPEGPNESASGT